VDQKITRHTIDLVGSISPTTAGAVSFAMRILVIENDDRDFQLIEHALEESGFGTKVIRVVDGVYGIDYLQGFAPFADRAKYWFPDVILLDLNMPRMSGFDVLDWLGKNPKLRVIPTIVMSSSALPNDVQRAYNQGANGYFVKPIEYEHFARLFRDIAAYWSQAITPKSGPSPSRSFQ
jgi:CheY-like chemotaxis protein